MVCLVRWWLNGNGDSGICFEMENSGETGRGKRQKTEEEVFFFLFLSSGTKLSFLDEIGRFLNLLDLVGIISNLRGGLWNLPY